MTRGVGGKSPSNIAKNLKGIDFPATKGDLVTRARENGAPEEVISVLDQLPDRKYGDMADLMKGVGQVE